ncbi:MAG: DUF2851 family protein [candidate division KSB1 bacterium]|nr:DUF2851 family protein [candidate division KSB1 bacterium]
MNPTPNTDRKAVSDEIVCALADKDPMTIQCVLEQMGRKQLVLKVARMLEKREILSWDQLLFANICQALGYSKNQISFQRLACNVPIRENFGTTSGMMPPKVGLLKCEAVLFGAAGFFGEESNLIQPEDPYVKETCRVVEYVSLSG